MTKKILIVSVLTSATLGALADRGVGKKGKNKVMLNISGSSVFKTNIPLNLRSGLRYTGSFLNIKPVNTKSPGFSPNSTVVTYQKGNTVYIIPYKQKSITAEMGKGYTGMKLIIRPH